MITLDDQIASVRREIGMRARVYPSWVAAGRMTKAKADHETQCMHAVLATLEACKEREEPELFGGATA